MFVSLLGPRGCCYNVRESHFLFPENAFSISIIASTNLCRLKDRLTLILRLVRVIIFINRLKYFEQNRSFRVIVCLGSPHLPPLKVSLSFRTCG